MRSKPQQSKNTSIGFIFIGLVLLILLISGIIKASDIFQKSKFDGKTNFNLRVIDQSKTQFVSFSPSSSSVEIVDVVGKAEDLGVPTDATIEDQPITSDNIGSWVSLRLIGKSGLNPFDSIRLVLFAKSVAPEKISERSLDSSSSQDMKLAGSIFSDDAISSEKITIHIINSSGVSGMGNQLAKIITNMGGNVILVTSSENIQDVSTIEGESKSLTFNKIKRVFGMKKVSGGETGPSDIKITIGKDLIGKL